MAKPMASGTQHPDVLGTIPRMLIAAVCLSLFALAASTGEAAAPSPSADNPALVEDGKEIFNSTCAHCHGPDAVQAEALIDLRLLRRKYGDRLEETFFKTVIDGRPAKGMPAWKYVFTPSQFDAVFAYLKTIQSD